MSRYTGPIKLVIMDIGGTVCDGFQDLGHLYPNDDGLPVKGPVIVFEQIFREQGMDVDWATIRRPMGKFKKEHLRDILLIDEVSEHFRDTQGRDWSENDVDEMFERFRPSMREVAVTDDLIRPFDGVKECVDRLHEGGILVGCDTGYPQETCDAIYSTLSEKFGITFDVTADPENVKGRPSPFLVYDCMDKANVYPPAAVVKVDDITAGMQEGRNSGAWTVGVYSTGAHRYETLLESGPDFLVPSVKYVPDIVYGQIQPRLMRGEMPGETCA